MAIIPKDPLDWMNIFQQRIDEMFSASGNTEGGCRLDECEFSPLIDIYETADEFIVEIELPGFEREELSLRTFHHILVVEGAKHQDPAPEGLRYIRMERAFGKFCRAVEMPPDLDLEGGKARYLDGLLKVTFRKLRQKQVMMKEIPIE